MKVHTHSFDAFHKMNTQKSSRSKNDRCNHEDNVGRQMDRHARAQFRHMKVELAMKDWH